MPTESRPTGTCPADAFPTDTFAPDAFLGGRLHLRQPAGLQRAGSDAVLLAAAVPALSGQRVVEIGTGTGAAALCLLARVAGTAVTGVELQADAALAAAQNAAANGLAVRFRVICADALRPAFRRRLGHAVFDHAMANPPFFAATGRRPAESPARERARAESAAGDLAAWVAVLAHLVRPGGTVTVIQRIERLPDLLAAFPGGGRGLAAAPLWPRSGQPAKRVLLRWRKDGRAPFRLGPGMVLHGGDGRYLPVAEAVLRDGAAIPDTAF
ncbi:tRNA1(Val) (adenine(37)-N6)-methyltransferase [Marinibaculum pumilum]|uniref:tRNA1(Val) (Adenine(37)-N6)-methyltransferase n=1 Tax=Marinibaculum pumilum TaxID=1766165 RepID=A0ABV7LAW5_9PROT